MSGNEQPPAGAEGLDRAIDLDETERVPRAISGSEMAKEKRTLGDWGMMLGKLMTVLAIAGATAWNGLNTYFVERARTAEAEKAREAHDEDERKAEALEVADDEGYTLLAKTVNAQSDKIKRLEFAIERVEQMGDYLDWKYNQDAERIGPDRLDRMIVRFVNSGPPPPVEEVRISHEELVARIVAELAMRQEEKRGGPVQLPSKMHHIPEQREFFK